MKIKGTFNHTEVCDKLEKALKYIGHSKSVEFTLKLELLGLDEEYRELEDDAELTLTEAAKELNLSDGAVLRVAINKGVFSEDEYRKVGKTYLLKMSAIERYRDTYKRNMGLIIIDGESAEYKIEEESEK